MHRMGMCITYAQMEAEMKNRRKLFPALVVSKVSNLSSLCCQQDMVLVSTADLPGTGICSSLLSFRPTVSLHLAESTPRPAPLSSDLQHQPSRVRFALSAVSHGKTQQGRVC